LWADVAFFGDFSGFVNSLAGGFFLQQGIFQSFFFEIFFTKWRKLTTKKITIQSSKNLKYSK
jgi:hypothetical protein